MNDTLDCMHFRAYRSSCLNDGFCPNRDKDADGHKFCKTLGIIKIQTSINMYRDSTRIVRDNGD